MFGSHKLSKLYCERIPLGKCLCVYTYTDTDIHTLYTQLRYVMWEAKCTSYPKLVKREEKVSSPLAISAVSAVERRGRSANLLLDRTGSLNLIKVVVVP